MRLIRPKNNHGIPIDFKSLHKFVFFSSKIEKKGAIVVIIAVSVVCVFFVKYDLSDIKWR